MEIAKVLRKSPWMVDAIRQRPMSILHPYMIEAYVTKDGSEACLSLNPPKAFCARDGAVTETRLELEFKRYEVYEDKKRNIPPQGAISIHHGGEGVYEGALATGQVYTSYSGVRYDTFRVTDFPSTSKYHLLAAGPPTYQLLPLRSSRSQKPLAEEATIENAVKTALRNWEKTWVKEFRLVALCRLLAVPIGCRWRS